MRSTKLWIQQFFSFKVMMITRVNTNPRELCLRNLEGNTHRKHEKFSKLWVNLESLRCSLYFEWMVHMRSSNSLPLFLNHASNFVGRGARTLEGSWRGLRSGGRAHERVSRRHSWHGHKIDNRYASRHQLGLGAFTSRLS